MPKFCSAKSAQKIPSKSLGTSWGPHWVFLGQQFAENLTKHLKQFAAFFFSASEEVVVGGEVPVAASEEVVITNNVDLPIEGSPFCYSTVNLWGHDKSP